MNDNKTEIQKLEEDVAEFMRRCSLYEINNDSFGFDDDDNYDEYNESYYYGYGNIFVYILNTNNILLGLGDNKHTSKSKSSTFLAQRNIKLTNITPKYVIKTHSNDSRVLCVLKFERDGVYARYQFGGWYSSYDGFEMDLKVCGFVDPYDVTFTDYKLRNKEE